MIFTQTILKTIVDEAFFIFKQLPIYKKFNLGYSKVSVKQGQVGEIIVCDYGCISMEIKLNFDVSIFEIDFFSDHRSATVKTCSGNWYSPDSVIIDGNIKILDSKSTVVYDESFIDNTILMFVTDKNGTMHSFNVEHDMTSCMH